VKVLIFHAGGSACALDGKLVRRISGAEEAPEGPTLDLATLFPGAEAIWATHVRMGFRGRPLVLRTTEPEGFREVEASALLPLPAFLFEGGKRTVRAVFVDSGQVVLLLDEEELARRAVTACS
jgi:hypothetical protein